MSKFLSFICVLAISGNLLTASGDINGDGVTDGSDLQLTNDFILGRKELSENQYADADLNGDGIVDSFDLVLMRKNLITADKQIPSGRYTAKSGDSVRHYNFFEGGGNYVDTATETGMAFEYEKVGNNITFYIGSRDNITHAAIEWNDDTHFSLLWDDGTIENFSPYTIPSGRYIAKSDDSVRHYNFFEGGGNYTYTTTGICMDFEYETVGNNITFYIGSRVNVIHAVIEWNDDTHFSLLWEDGTMESFSPCRTEVINGVTYIDGILIANKSYGLPADYNPAGLTADTQQAFSEMSSAASRDGICLCVYSGFRSYSYQQQIYNNYVALYGQATADTFSARAGHSEHQTGLAIDVNCADDSFDGTPEALWLAENSWKYGFIIRYPKGKQNITGYKYEPWHIRYIGKEKAEDVYKSRLTLEEYLGIDSVYK